VAVVAHTLAPHHSCDFPTAITADDLSITLNAEKVFGDVFLALDKMFAPRASEGIKIIGGFGGFGVAVHKTIIVKSTPR
jgi:hypothetical protein